MAVMVDGLRPYPHAPATIARWCHMAADSGSEELHAFATRLGISRRAFHGDHYDLPLVLRARAVQLGAQEVDTGELLLRMWGPRGDRARRRAARTSPTRGWPASAPELEVAQRRLSRLHPPPWHPGTEPLVAACFACFPRGATGRGASGEAAWVAAVVMRGPALMHQAVLAGEAAAPYEAGRLALREGPLLEAAVRALGGAPEVVLVDATARDHPRGGGLALHLGAVLDLPTIGVTHRPLLADGAWPASDEAGATSPLWLGGASVGFWLRTRARTRPLAVHPGWRIGADGARDVVLAAAAGVRTPAPLRVARQLARTARAAGGR